MHPSFHSHLINDPFGDPGLYVDFKFRRRALLFDLGDLATLSSRKLLRISDVFVSHTHMDHFGGFDRLLRTVLGRDKRLTLFGPPGFIDRVQAKLNAYTWNLAPEFKTELILCATEVTDEEGGRAAEFRLRDGFARRDHGPVEFRDGVLVEEPAFRIRFAILDHGIPCLAFALEESRHVNIWRNKVAETGLAMGPWLAGLKEAVLRNDPDDTPIPVQRRGEESGAEALKRPLGELTRDLVSITPGQRIVYVTDAAPHAKNDRAITDLARDADILYAETPFLEADADIARTKNHMTARRTGLLARRAGARLLVPFHFSTRYAERGDLLESEALAAFHGTGDVNPTPEE